MMVSDRVRVLIGDARRALAAAPGRLIECDACQVRNFGRADRTVCLHRTKP